VESAKPTAVPLFSQPVFELHLRVEFKLLKRELLKYFLFLEKIHHYEN